MAMSGRAGAAKVGKLKQDDSARLEEETRSMEARLASLRNMVEEDKASVQRRSKAADGSGGTRWNSASAAKPLTRGYAQNVLNKKTTPRKAAAAKPGDVVGKLEEMGEFVKLPDFVPQLAASGASSDAQKVVGARFQQKISQDNAEAQEVSNFLEGLGLARYVTIFSDNGFDDMETVLEMTETHMDTLGISMGHKLKLGRKIRELKPPPTPPQPRASRPDGRRAQFSSSPATHATPPAERVERDQAGSSLLDGEYDEAAEAASFAAAVAAWRTGGAEEAPAKVEEASSLAPFSWSNVGASAAWANPLNVELPEQDEDAEARPTSAAITGPESPSRAKAACYRCYAQFFLDAPGTVDRFCSEACNESHEQEQKAQAARREELSSTQRKLQERIEYVDENAVDDIDPAASPPTQADVEPLPEGSEPEPAAAVWAPQPVARELLPAM